MIGLLRRSDALGHAYTLILDANMNEVGQEEATIVSAMRKEAGEQVERYKQEVGITERSAVPPA